MREIGAADKAESLTGCKSLYRQLPVFGRLAYPVRAEVTKHDRPGRKSPGCPAAVFRSGRDDLGGEQTWRPEHHEISASSKTTLREVVIRGTDAGSRPIGFLGKADDTVEETGESTRWYRRGRGSSIQGKILRDNVGKLPWTAGTAYNLQRLFERGLMPKEERDQREWHMSQ